MHRLTRLPGEVLSLLSAVIFAWSNVIMKMAVQEVPALQVVWIRFTLAAAFFGVAAWRGWIPMKTRRPGLLFARGVCASLGVVCSFYAVSLTTFSNYSILIYTNPLLGTLLSTWWFGERFRAKHLMILALTFIGVYAILQPQWRGVQLGDGLALLAGVFFGCALALVKEATKTESVWALTLSFYVLVSLITVPAAWAGRAAVPGIGWAWILSFMTLGTCAQLLETRAYQSISVTVGGTLSYLTVVLSIGLGAWLFHEPLTLSFLLGAALIIGCGMYLIWNSAAPIQESSPAPAG